MHRIRLISLRLLLLLVALIVLSACATPPVPASTKQDPIDLQRYMGRWYVIAHVPYFAERGNVASSDNYTLRRDGRIDVRYLYRTGFAQPLKAVDSVGTVEPGTGNHQWKQRFFHVIPAKYRILEVAPDYSWALVDYPGRDLAWVFGRTPVMDDVLYQQLLGTLRGYGVNSDKLWRVPQVKEQVGALGFDRPEDP